MGRRLLVFASIGLNAILATALVVSLRNSQRPARSLKALPFKKAAVTTLIRTNVEVRRINFTWDQVESDNYEVYIKGLREIGCPEDTVRDIIIGDINELYAQKRLTEIVTPDQKWWQSDPDPQIEKAARDKFNQLENERKGLLTHLLGPDWEMFAIRNSPDTPMAGLSDPILGGLTKEKKMAVRDVYARAAIRARSLTADGKDDRSPEMIKNRLETRQALAALLSPEQMEEYLLRYSQNAAELRRELKGFNTSPEEFRALFRATDAIDLKRQILSAGEEPPKKELAELETQRMAAIKKVLPEGRFDDYKMNLDPVFRDFRATAQNAGVPAETLVPLYLLTEATKDEEKRITTDPDLGPEQKDEALKELEETKRVSLRKLLGAEGYTRFTKSTANP